MFLLCVCAHELRPEIKQQQKKIDKKSTRIASGGYIPIHRCFKKKKNVRKETRIERRGIIHAIEKTDREWRAKKDFFRKTM